MPAVHHPVFMFKSPNLLTPLNLCYQPISLRFPIAHGFTIYDISIFASCNSFSRFLIFSFKSLFCHEILLTSASFLTCTMSFHVLFSKVQIAAELPKAHTDSIYQQRQQKTQPIGLFQTDGMSHHLTEEILKSHDSHQRCGSQTHESGSPCSELLGEKQTTVQQHPRTSHSAQIAANEIPWPSKMSEENGEHRGPTV